MNALTRLGVLSLLVSMAATASAAPVVISDPYVMAGVGNSGTLGYGSSTSPGILYDPTGVSAYGINDFLAPISPLEGFYISSSSIPYSQFSNNSGGTTFSTESLSWFSQSTAQWTGTSLDGSLKVSHLYSVSTAGTTSSISIATTLTNLSGHELESLQFLRILDPDPDVNVYGAHFSINSVISSDEVCATGPQSGQTICLFSNSTTPHGAGVSFIGDELPFTYRHGLNLGNGDYTIGLAFSVGTLGAGDSITLDYSYNMAPTLSAVTPVPEPSSWLTMLTGVGLIALRTKRR